MEENKRFAVAIDGPSGAGKSTLARSVARELGAVYVDTGAIYRTVGYGAWRQGIDPGAEEEICALLPQLEISMAYDGDGLQRMYLNGEDVTREIRLPPISLYASRVSAIPAVRSFLMDMQRDMARRCSVVMDGRDIGTVVLPQADVKIFLTASVAARARRRGEALRARGTPTDFTALPAEIRQRDHNDESRAAAPLRAAEDAVRLDTTGNTFEESRRQILKIIKERLGR